MICFFLIFCCSPTTQMHKHLEVHGFDSSTNQSTHKQGGWLDVITSRKSVNINIIDSCISDHKLLFWSCEMLKPFPIYWQLQIIRRNFLDTEKFISEVKLFLFSAATCLELNSAFDLYNSTLSGIFDKMISLKTVRVQERLFDPWFDGKFHTSKCLKRSLERIYMKTKSEYNFAAWLGRKKLYKRLCRHKHKDYWNKKINHSKNKTTNIWSRIDSVSGWGKRFSEKFQPVDSQYFFSQKVESVKYSIQARKETIYLAHAQKGSLRRFQDVDEDELLRLFRSFPTQCASDPILTWLLKKIFKMISSYAKVWSISLLLKELS